MRSFFTTSGKYCLLLHKGFNFLRAFPSFAISIVCVFRTHGIKYQTAFISDIVGVTVRSLWSVHELNAGFSLRRRKDLSSTDRPDSLAHTDHTLKVLLHLAKCKSWIWFWFVFLPFSCLLVKILASQSLAGTTKMRVWTRDGRLIKSKAKKGEIIRLMSFVVFTSSLYVDEILKCGHSNESYWAILS